VGTEGCVNIRLISSCSPRKPCKTELLLPSGVGVGLIVCVRFVLKLSGTHKHIKFSNIRYRRRSFFKSISLAVGVAVSLHHQYCDFLCEIQQKILIRVQHCASFLSGKKVVATASSLAVGSVDLVHCVRLVQTHVGTGTCCVAAVQGWTCLPYLQIGYNCFTAPPPPPTFHCQNVTFALSLLPPKITSYI
jgi:hypothetical protein